MIGRTNSEGSAVNTDDLTTTPSDVLTGKKFYGTENDEIQIGVMPERGAQNATLNCGQSYTILAGHHNGDGRVTANSLASQTGGVTATDDKVLAGSTYWKDGMKRTGDMTHQGAKTASLKAGGSYTIPAGFHNGSGRVTANSLASQTPGSATAGQIWTGRTAWVNGSKLTGTLATQGGSTTTPGTSNKTIVSPNKIVTGSVVVAGDANLKAENIIRGKTIFGVKGTAIYAGDVPGYFLEPPKEYESLTGGWMTSSYGGRFDLEKGTTTYNLSLIVSSTKQDICNGTLKTVNEIDLSKYRYVYIDYADMYYTLDTHGYRDNITSKTIEVTCGSSVLLHLTTIKQSGTLKIDVSNVSSLTKLEIRLRAGTSSISVSNPPRCDMHVKIKAVRYDAF